MIEVRNLIKKEQKDVYVVETGNPLQPRLEFFSLKEACSALAGKYYRVELGAKISERTRINTKRYLLATRLEREFLRGNEYIGVIELIYTESSDIDDIFNESVFFKGEINIKNINHLIKSFNSDKERLENIFKSEYGTYHFGVIENAIADRYEFELIDFKPLEVSSE